MATWADGARDDVRKAIVGFFSGNQRKADAWFDTVNVLLGGQRPRDMMLNDRDLLKLRRWIHIALDENRR